MNPKKYLSCKGVAKEWKNQDMPDIYRTDGTRAIEITFPNYEAVIYADTDKEAYQLQQWLLKNGVSEDKIFI